MKDLIKGIAGIVAVALLIGFGIWSRIDGPCELWAWAPAKDIPGRCIMNGGK